MASILTSLFAKNQSAQFLKEAGRVVEAAGLLAQTLEEETQEALQARLEDVRARTGGIPVKDEDVALVFALVREAARRTLNERHYDVQLLGGLTLARKHIAEMRTGEGKTLVATLPVTLHALSGKGVHVVTVNDYLARRDAAWMGQVYAYLGLSVGVVTSGGSYLYDASHTPEVNDEDRDAQGSYKVFYEFLRPASKKEAYDADITYATNNELGFDYLRDNTAYDASQINQRGHHYAIVDEIDSILIDEARTPLIISGPAPESESLYERFAAIVRSFTESEDYTVDEKQKAVQITEEGMQKAEKALGIENLYAEGGMRYVHFLDTAVRAKALFRADKEYVIKDGEVVIVDEFTGRLQPGRRWSEGLHQAIEAKEGLAVQKETRTYASVTFQNYFRMYGALSGMTGTGLSSEEEFYTVYGLDVVVVPTHRAIARKDYDDLIFQTVDGKLKALARNIKDIHAKGQPVLVGTVSIEDNEIVSAHLRNEGVEHEVLNAKNHEREGEIIAEAGKRGRVTVATNLAGRGVDIKLGGPLASPEDREEIRSLGGLAVIGTERHEARRIDNQLRGRSGRQGDPGETRFYVSLEDKLMRVFASDMIRKVMGTFKIPEDEPIESGMITKSLETAQKRIEGFNFDSRKQVLAYDDVLNTQRLSIYAERRTALIGTDADIHDRVRACTDGVAGALDAYTAKQEELGEAFVPLMRRLILQVTDAFWLEHLDSMEQLRRSVSLRAYGQRDPLIEYRREGLSMFTAMQSAIALQIAEAIPHIVVTDDSRIRAEEERARRIVLENSGATSAEPALPSVRTSTYGRNDEVTIKKGEEVQTMKFKKAEPLLSEGWEVVR